LTPDEKNVISLAGFNTIKYVLLIFR